MRRADGSRANADGRRRATGTAVMHEPYGESDRGRRSYAHYQTDHPR